MDFFVDGGGNILRVTPENVYQGSANAQTIRFIGAFPANATVTIAYTLPTGDNTSPLPMTSSGQLSGIEDEDTGAVYCVWEIPLGVKYNSEGQAVPDYNITAHYGTVGVQFTVTQNNGQGKPAVLATALSSFNVLKGVPSSYVYDPADLDNIQGLLQNIYVQMSDINGSQGDIQQEQEKIAQDVEEISQAQNATAQELESAKVRLDLVEEELARFPEDFGELVGDVQALTDKVDLLDGRVDAIDTDINTVKTELEDVKSASAATAGEVAALQQTVDENKLQNLALELNTFNYTLTLLDGSGNAISSVDFPLESVVVNGEYNNETKSVVLTLQNGNKVEFPVGDLVDGLATDEQVLSLAHDMDAQDRRMGRIEDTLADKIDKVPYNGYVGTIPVRLENEESAVNMATLVAPNTLVYRDANGRSKIEGPVDTYDIANKGYVDTTSKKYRHRLVLNVEMTNADGTVSEYQLETPLISSRSTPYTIEAFNAEFLNVVNKPSTFMLIGYNYNDTAVRVISALYVCDNNTSYITMYLRDATSGNVALVEGTPTRVFIRSVWQPKEI